MYYKRPEYAQGIQSVELLTATEIKTYVEEKSGQKLSQWKIGQELKALGFEQEVRRMFGKTQRLYRVIVLNPEDLSAEKYKKEAKDHKPSGLAF
jgi:hypothetical protein